MTDMFVSAKMCKWIVIVLLLIVFAAATTQEEQECGPLCSGKEHECIEGSCSCAPGFTLDPSETICEICPGLGDKCFNTCCNSSLGCWDHVCVPCYGSFGTYPCRENNDDQVIRTTRIVLGTGLILGFFVAVIYLVTLCATDKLRAVPTPNNGDQLSSGNLGSNVEDSQRDAPQRSSVLPSPTSTTETACTNTSYVPDNPVPLTHTPKQTEDIKLENGQNNVLYESVNESVITY